MNTFPVRRLIPFFAVTVISEGLYLLLQLKKLQQLRLNIQMELIEVSIFLIKKLKLKFNLI